MAAAYMPRFRAHHLESALGGRLQNAPCSEVTAAFDPSRRRVGSPSNSKSVMSNILNDLDPSQGDLLYGLADARSKVIKEAREQKLAWVDEYVVIVDDYSHFFTSSPMLLDPEGLDDQQLQEAFNKAARKDVQDVATSLNQMGSGEVQRFKEYGKALMASEKHSPVSVYKASADKLKKQGTLQKTDVEYWNRAFLAIRRNCKFGVGHVATEVIKKRPNARIRFLLDYLDMDEVVGGDDGSKKGERFVNQGSAYTAPITLSELRYTFRHWDLFKNGVVFYINDASIDAPWEGNWDCQLGYGGVQVYARRDKWEKYGRYVQEKRRAKANEKGPEEEN